MNRITFSTFALATLAAGLVVTGHGTAQAQDAKLDQLKDNLGQEFQRQFVGYSIAIAQHGRVKRTITSGLARREEDGRKEWNDRTRANIASVSKSITAIAVLQALEANGLTIEEPVAPYLPAGWARGRGFKVGQSVTFRQLLTHRSGMNQRFKRLKANGNEGPWGNDWAGLKFAVEKGVGTRFLTSDKYNSDHYEYKNSNYALFRIIVPILWRKAAGRDGSGVTKANHGTLFGLYVGEKVLVPSGVGQASCTEPASRGHAYAYDWQNRTTPGVSFDGSWDTCGAHAGWRLSARHLAKIGGRADCNSKNQWPTNKKLLSPGSCFARTVRKLGWSESSNSSDPRRKDRYWHGGDLFSPKSGERSAIHSCMIIFPDGISVGVIANSDSRDGESVCSKALDAGRFL
ncbi:MAG: serine hydrolase domain-containing protein [Erythrobacter sp.]